MYKMLPQFFHRKNTDHYIAYILSSRNSFLILNMSQKPHISEVITPNAEYYLARPLQLQYNYLCTAFYYKV